jgi:hypothetical protein
VTRLPLVGPTLPADPLDGFPSFIDRVRSRLAAGREAYGDESFLRPIAELLNEIEEELLDVCGWSFVLWERLQAMKKLHAANMEPAALTAPNSEKNDV